jgi:hypothetical protein
MMAKERLVTRASARTPGEPKHMTDDPNARRDGDDERDLADELGEPGTADPVTGEEGETVPHPGEPAPATVEGAALASAARTTTTPPSRGAASARPADELPYVDDPVSKWWVAIIIAVFVLIFAYALLFGRGGLIGPIGGEAGPTPQPTPVLTVSPSPSPAAESPSPSPAAESPSPSPAASPAVSPSPTAVPEEPQAPTVPPPLPPPPPLSGAGTGSEAAPDVSPSPPLAPNAAASPAVTGG